MHWEVPGRQWLSKGHVSLKLGFEFGIELSSVFWPFSKLQLLRVLQLHYVGKRRANIGLQVASLSNYQEVIRAARKRGSTCGCLPTRLQGTPSSGMLLPSTTTVREPNQCTFCRDGKGRSQQVELSQPFPGLARFMVETFPPGTDDGIEVNPDCGL